MFAVVKTGGKQYKVAANNKLQIERMPGEAGDVVEFDEVLVLGGDEGGEIVLGTPHVEGAVVRAEVLEQFRGPKVVSFVKRRRKHSSQRRRGHRQHLTMVRITEILPNGAARSAKAAAKTPAESEAPAAQPAAVEAAES